MKIKKIIFILLMITGFGVFAKSVPEHQTDKKIAFHFKREYLVNVLSEVSQYYHCEVVWSDNSLKKDIRLTAVILKSTDLPQILNVIEIAIGKVKFRMSGSRVLVFRKDQF